MINPSQRLLGGVAASLDETASRTDARIARNRSSRQSPSSTVRASGRIGPYPGRKSHMLAVLSE